MGIRIDELNAALNAQADHVIPAMRGGVTVGLTVAQISTLITALLVDSAPSTLDTLNELAAALGDDPNFAATIANAIALKADAARTISSGGLIIGGGDLSADRTLTVTKSSQAQALAGTNDDTAMTPVRVRDAVMIVESGSVALTGTSTDVLNIPAGARRVTITLDNVSLNGTADVFLRLGTSGGVVATGYAGSAWRGGSGVASTLLSTEFNVLTLGAAANVGGATITLVRAAGNTWRCASAGELSNAALTSWCNGRVTLGAALDRIRILTSNGTDTFDGGSVVNVFWEF